jgi:uncharacterized membrane protein/HAMP domain-containing protein
VAGLLTEPPGRRGQETGLSALAVIEEGEFGMAEKSGKETLFNNELKKRILIAIIGAVVYGALSWLTTFMRLSEALGVDLRPAVALPIMLGFIYGPGVGFFVGLAGNALGDYLSWSSFYWNWTLGNGLIGFFPGLYGMFWGRYRDFKDLGKAILFMVFGIASGMFLAAVLDIWICREPSPACFVAPVTWEYTIQQQFIPATWVNLISSLIIVLPLLYNYERFDVMDLRDRSWLQSGLIRQLATVSLVSVLVPFALLGFFLTQKFGGEEAAGGVGLQLGITLLLTLAFALFNALALGRSLSRPLLKLISAAALLDEGKLTHEQAQELSKETAQGQEEKQTAEVDEIMRLSNVFYNMALQVLRREEQYREQIQQLRIEIDETKRQQQVSEIVDTDFFSELQAKAREMRRRSRS